jgi:hypothetical protein
MNNPAVRYKQAVANIPTPGCGNGCHGAILGAANLGVFAGRTPEAISVDLRKSIPRGKRFVSDREIADAVNKAFSDHADGSFAPAPKPKPIVNNGAVVLRRLIEQGKGTTEESIQGTSPVPIPARSEDHVALVLQTLYHPDDFLFIGERYGAGIIGETIRSAGRWTEYFSKGGRTAPHIIVNPLDGKPHEKKSGDDMTYRGDACVAAYHLCVVEFDNLSRDDQLAFWRAAALPVCALIDSGGKSIHAWVSVPKLAPVSTAEEWDKQIQDELYRRLLIPLGVDGACANPSRLSRLPGHLRSEKGRMQRLLYLAPEGRRISP